MGWLVDWACRGNEYQIPSGVLHFRGLAVLHFSFRKMKEQSQLHASLSTLGFPWWYLVQVLTRVNIAYLGKSMR